MSNDNLTANNLPPRPPLSVASAERESPLTLGWVFAVLTPALGIMAFLALRGIIGPENFTSVGYILLFPCAQIIGATFAFAVGYTSYDLAERRGAGRSIVVRAVSSVALVALPIFLGMRSIIDVRDVSNAALLVGSLFVSVAVTLLVVHAGKN